jgi:hypothetical protein
MKRFRIVQAKKCAARLSRRWEWRIEVNSEYNHFSSSEMSNADFTMYAPSSVMLDTYEQVAISINAGNYCRKDIRIVLPGNGHPQTHAAREGWTQKVYVLPERLPVPHGYVRSSYDSTSKNDN